MSERLDEAAIGAECARLRHWTRDGDALTRRFEFADFAAAMQFVNRVAAVAEAHRHHPDIDIRWNKVGLRLSTHSAGGLTAKDFALAQAIDAESINH